MKKIDLNIPMTDLSGAEVKEAKLGQILGNQLVGGSKGDALKFYDWAVKLYKGDSISVDDSDFNKIKDFVNESEMLTIIAKAQILKQLEKAEEVK